MVSGPVNEGAALRFVRVINETRGILLAEEAEVAGTFWRRAKGLMGRDSLPAGGGVVLVPCNSVHSMMMRFPIDVIHIAQDGTVLRTLTPLHVFRLGPLVRGSHYVVELAAGCVSRTGTRVGDRIRLETVGCGPLNRVGLLER